MNDAAVPKLTTHSTNKRTIKCRASFKLEIRLSMSVCPRAQLGIICGQQSRVLERAHAYSVHTPA